MPPKSMQLEQARAAKQANVTETEPTLPEASSSVPADSPQPSTSGASFSEPTDPEIHTEDEEMYDGHSAMANYALEWVESLSRDDLLSLSVLLWYLLVGILSFKLTDAAEMIGKVLGRSDRTIASENGESPSMLTKAPSQTQCKGGINEMVCYGIARN